MNFSSTILNLISDDSPWLDLAFYAKKSEGGGILAWVSYHINDDYTKT